MTAGTAMEAGKPAGAVEVTKTQEEKIHYHYQQISKPPLNLAGLQTQKLLPELSKCLTPIKMVRRLMAVTL